MRYIFKQYCMKYEKMISDLSQWEDRVKHWLADVQSMNQAMHCRQNHVVIGFRCDRTVNTYVHYKIRKQKLDFYPISGICSHKMLHLYIVPVLNARWVIFTFSKLAMFRRKILIKNQDSVTGFRYKIANKNETVRVSCDVRISTFECSRVKVTLMFKLKWIRM